MTEDFAPPRILEKRSKILDAFLIEHRLDEPKSVEYKPLAGCERERCFTNVTAQISKSGGRIEMGWMFMEIASICIYTIAHAIWITTQGRRTDVTPQFKHDGRRILFLPDERVAIKRGVTAGYRTIYTSDPQFRAIALFDGELDRLFEDAFVAIGKPVRPIPDIRVREAAARSGLDWEFARTMMQDRCNGELALI
jgi:hypothetical protein